jgi:polyhydroxyalkanoate synthesis regulator phasin
MIDYLKKSLLTGFGLALKSKNEIEELAKVLAKKSEMNQDEAKDFLKECLTKYSEAKDSFDKKLESVVEKTLKRLDLPSRSDIQALNDRIDALNKKLNKDS